ncbi:MFS transporter [Arthrobacter sp. NPDC090010]|uniref:MFS transporter n=1 Tax=Arthrobacter sp. NPDC090010 TaxID=3363942 RepID=UPI00381D014F
MSVINELRMRPASREWGWEASTTARLVLSGVVIFLLLVGANLATPLYPALQAELSLGPFGTTVAFSSYVLSLVATLMLAGHWSDHIGRRAALVISVLIGLGGTVVFGLAQNLVMLCAGRVLQGISVALATGASAAALRELLPSRPEWASRFTLLASSGGVAAGPALGGLLSLLPGGRQAPFFLQGLALVLILLPLCVIRARPAIMRAEQGYNHRALAPRAVGVPSGARGAFWLAALVGFLSFAVFGFQLSLAPGYFAHALGVSSAPLVGVLAGLSLAASALSQLTAISGRLTVPGGLLVLGAALLLMGWATAQPSLLLLVLASIAAGFGQGLAFRTVFNQAATAVPATQHAQMVSTVYVVTYLGSAVPVLGLGAAASILGMTTAALGFSVLAAAAAFILAAVSLKALRRG